MKRWFLFLKLLYSFFMMPPTLSASLSSVSGEGICCSEASANSLNLLLVQRTKLPGMVCRKDKCSLCSTYNIAEINVLPSFPFMNFEHACLVTIEIYLKRQTTPAVCSFVFNISLFFHPNQLNSNPPHPPKKYIFHCQREKTQVGLHTV